MKKVLSIIMCAVMAVTCISFSASAKKVTVKAPKLTSVVQTDLNIVKVNWSKVSGAKGYVLYYSTNGRSYKKLTTTTKRNYVHKKLTNNRKYYYKLKSYKKVSGKTVYSKFSNIKTVKPKNDLLAIYKPYRTLNCNVYRGDNKFEMSGNTYRYGLCFIMALSDAARLADFNLKGKYRYISFTYGDVNLSGETTLDIKSDDEVIESLTVKPGDIAKTIKVNIENANKLEFMTYRGDLGVANIKLHK